MTAEGRISFSVVVPFYNRSTQLDRLLFSVVHQTVAPLEVLIVDNGSLEIEVLEAKRIIDLYSMKSNILFFASHERGNANFARNAGTLASVGDYIAYLDSDDWWETNHLETAELALKELPPGSALYSSYLIHKAAGTKIIPNRGFKKNESPLGFLFSLDRGFAQSSGLIVPAQVAKKILWSNQLRRNQDYDFFWRVSREATWCLKATPTVNVDWAHDQNKAIDYDSVFRFYDSTVAIHGTRMERLFFLLLTAKESMIRRNGRDYFSSIADRLSDVSWPLGFIFKIAGFSNLKRLVGVFDKRAGLMNDA